MRRATVIALCAVLAGCGGRDGGGVLPPAPERTAVPGDTAVRPAPEPEPVAAATRGGGSSPREVAAAYARAFTNWSWRDVAATSGDVLAGLAAGRLRESAIANAAALRQDMTLERDRRGNHGEQLAIDVQDGGAETRSVWVVMRETASIDGNRGLSDTRVRVYKLTVRRSDDGRWYVTGFEPQG